MKMPARASTLHGWLYERVQSVCFDRDYLYRCYVEHYCALMREIYAAGSIAGGGHYVIPGLKSGLQAVLSWQVAHRVSFQGPNLLGITAVLRNDNGETEGGTDAAEFELSTGMAVTL